LASSRYLSCGVLKFNFRSYTVSLAFTTKWDRWAYCKRVLARLLRPQLPLPEALELPGNATVGRPIGELKLGDGENKQHAKDSEREDGTITRASWHHVDEAADRCIEEGTCTSNKGHSGRDVVWRLLVLEGGERAKKKDRQRRSIIRRCLRRAGTGSVGGRGQGGRSK
jgi:hypothetical protein